MFFACEVWCITNVFSINLWPESYTPNLTVKTIPCQPLTIKTHVITSNQLAKFLNLQKLLVVFPIYGLFFAIEINTLHKLT